jgi:predicted amidophosphoribosyltransferase
MEKDLLKIVETCPYCLTDLTTTGGKHYCKECQNDILTMNEEDCFQNDGLCENCRELKRD